MSGIEIINTYEQVTEKQGTMTGFWIALILSAGLCILFITHKIKKDIIKEKQIDYQFLFHSILMSFIISLFCGGLGLLIETKPTEYETIYEVSVSEEVQLKEFLYHYEIVEIKEDTILIKDKILTKK